MGLRNTNSVVSPVCTLFVQGRKFLEGQVPLVLMGMWSNLHYSLRLHSSFVSRPSLITIEPFPKYLFWRQFDPEGCRKETLPPVRSNIQVGVGLILIVYQDTTFFHLSIERTGDGTWGVGRPGPEDLL